MRFITRDFLCVYMEIKIFGPHTEIITIKNHSNLGKFYYSSGGVKIKGPTTL